MSTIENSPVEMMWFFLIGIAGSAVQLFILLLVSGDISVIKNKVMPTRAMVPLYILVGGFVTMLYSLTFQDSLIPSNIWKVFLVGVGWQGLIVSYAIAKKAEEGEKAPLVRDSVDE